MTLDATILIGAITTLGGVVGYLWKEIRKDTTTQTTELRKQLLTRGEELNACLVRERGLLARIAEGDEHDG
jgi:hypothetical protein